MERIASTGGEEGGRNDRLNTSLVFFLIFVLPLVSMALWLVLCRFRQFPYGIFSYFHCHSSVSCLISLIFPFRSVLSYYFSSPPSLADGNVPSAVSVGDRMGVFELRLAEICGATSCHI